MFRLHDIENVFANAFRARFIIHAHIAGFGARKTLDVRNVRQLRALAADFGDIAADDDIKLREQLARKRPRRNAHCRFARARAFAHHAQIIQIIFRRAREVGVTGTRNRLRRRHLVLPIFPIEIFDQHADGRADGFAIDNAARNLRAVLFNFHAPARTITCLASAQIVIDFVNRNGQARGQSFDNAGQRGSV